MQPMSYKIKNRFIAISFCSLFILTACPKAPTLPLTEFKDEFVIAEIQSDADIADLADKYLEDRSKGWVISEFNSIETITPGQKKVVVVPLEPFNLGGLEPMGYQTVPILAYHRFSKSRSKKINVSEKAFEAQMKFLKENNYHVIGLNQLSDFCEYNAPIPSKAVVITIDDGSQSFWDIAFPILKKYNYPFTIFIHTAFIGNKRTLTWDQLKQIAEHGGNIQSFTMSHRNLAKIRKKESFREYLIDVEKEIVQSKQKIKRKLDQECQYMAYPYGATNQLIIKLLKKHGYRAALGTDRGSNPFFVIRYNMHRSFIFSDYDLKKFKKNLVIYKGPEHVLPKPHNLIKGDPALVATPEPTLISLSKNYMAKAQELQLNAKFTNALYYWEIANRLNPENREIYLKTDELKKFTTSEAEKYFEKGKSFYNQKAFAKAQDAFLTALRYNPNHVMALNYLIHKSERKEVTLYKVKKGDTLIKIANTIYKDPQTDILIAFYNDLTSPIKLEPGTLLKIPVLQKTLTERLRFRDKLNKAHKLLKAGEFDKVLTLIDEILEKDHSNNEATLIGNAVYLQWAKKLRDKKKFSRALGKLSEADPNDKGVDRLRAELEKKLQNVLTQVSAEMEKVDALFQAGQIEKVSTIGVKIRAIDYQDKKAADLINTKFFQMGHQLSNQNKAHAALQMYNIVESGYNGLSQAIADVMSKIEKRTKARLDEAQNLMKSDQNDKKVLTVIDEIRKYSYLNAEVSDIVNSTCLHIGQQMKAKNRFFTAIEMFKKIDTDTPFYEQAKKEISATQNEMPQYVEKLLNAGQFEKALSTAEQILGMAVLNKEAVDLPNKIYYQWGQKLRREKKYLEAVAKLNKADANYPGVLKEYKALQKEMKKQATIYLKRGEDAYIAEKFKEAEIEFTKCLALDADKQKKKKNLIRVRQILKNQ